MNLYYVIEENYPSDKSMNRDQELLRKSEALNSPILRIYSWSKPTISLGRMQKANEVLNLNICNSQDIFICNRPTGGRGVFHIDDVTYSFSFPTSLSNIFGSSVAKSYESIAMALQTSFNLLNIQTKLSCREISSSKAREEIKLPCFIAPAKQEILLNGKKLVGSAQLRKSFGVLQHGSIPLNSNFTKLPLYENCLEDEAKDRLNRLNTMATNLNESRSTNLSFKDLANALINGFSKEFNLKLIELL